MDGLEEKLNKILNDPKALSSVMEIAKSLNENGEKNEKDDSGGKDGENNGGNGLLSSLDPATMGKLLGLLGEFNRDDDKRTHLLKALKPYVSKERQDKFDRAAQIVKLAKTAHKAIDSFGGNKDV